MTMLVQYPGVKHITLTLKIAIICILCIQNVYSQYTIHTVKDLLRRNAIEPGDIYISPNLEAGICNCQQDLRAIATFPDSTIVTSPIILGYPRSTILNCKHPKKPLYAVYRILLNQTDVNDGVCKNEHHSKDISDAIQIFPNPLPPIPTTTKPPTPVPTNCPKECKDLIHSIPVGPPGPPGPPGNYNQTNGYVGFAPTRKLKPGINRTFADVQRAFTKYTGCLLTEDEGYLWNINKNRLTDCKVAYELYQPLKDVLQSTKVTVGYIVIWFWNNHENWYTNSMIYRTEEDDIIPGLCGHDPSPVFLPQLLRNSDDVKCSYGKPTTNKGLISYGIGFSSGLLILMIVLRHKIIRFMQIIKYFIEFMKNIIRNYDNQENDAQDLVGEFQPLIQ